MSQEKAFRKMSGGKFALTAWFIVAAVAPCLADGQPAVSFDDLRLRNIGPAFSPGRVADIAVDPRNPSIWYLATASSGLWKTDKPRRRPGNPSLITAVPIRWVA